MPTDPHFIVNPAAAGGRALRWWKYALPVLQKRFGRISFAVSNERQSLAELTAAAVTAGHERLVGVGGDGTHHDIINALVHQNHTDRITYAPLPLGSGNDWCRTLRVPRHLIRWMQVYQKGKTINHRIGKLTFGAGAQVQYFINVAGLAYDAEVVRRSANLDWKHRLLYPLLTAAYLPGFQPPKLALKYDSHTIEGRFHTINLGIGRYNGGGMQPVPQADPTADILALTYAVNTPVNRIIRNSWRLFTPTIGEMEGVTTTHAREVTVTGPTGLEADGEFLGTGPVRAELIEQRLRVVCGWPA
ncbi:YegS/Rv2252/BmrU family lipid kinase [Lewinella aquimaris]|uniref:YegS/Rv2252/BmrU family lipid kinase n=1 Tax=Neolewinella aquimaris TaxID=1835722 RepID=A0A840E209_9BACT|nr:diacylglycerol kinase family protein [Neolewinella aquimaris]MBB4079261.1 YegS/Rv2252/BmrU family lipid kinase [Neolewinella aquimaris]